MLKYVYRKYCRTNVNNFGDNSEYGNDSVEENYYLGHKKGPDLKLAKPFPILLLSMCYFTLATTSFFSAIVCLSCMCSGLYFPRGISLKIK